MLFSEVSDGTDRVWPRSLAWGWALHPGRRVWAAPGLQGWRVCVCTPVLFPVVLAPDVAERVPPARATAPPAESQVHSPPQAHQGTCSCCVPAVQLGSQCVCLSPRHQQPLGHLCLPADRKLSGAAFWLHPHMRAVPDTSQMFSTCANRPLELPAPGTRSQCFQSWQGPRRPPPVSPALLTPCPVWHRGPSALPLSHSPLREGNSHFFSVIHCASSRHLPSAN